MLVEVRRPDRQPAVVDDADLRVDVDRFGRPVPPRHQRATQQSPIDIGVAEHRQLAARVVRARARVRRQHHDHPERVRWRPPEQIGEDLDDFARPEELVLEIHQGASRSKCPHVRLQDREVAEREAAVEVFGHGPRDLHGEVTRGRGGPGRREPLAGHLLPAHPEVAGDIFDDRPLRQHGRVVPAGAAPDRMTSAVETVAVEVGEVDPADKRLTAVDDHELLVMTVHRSLATIGCDVKSRAIGQLGHHRLDLAPPGPEQR